MNKKFRRKLLIISTIVTLAIFIISVGFFIGIQLFISYKDLGDLNQETFNSIICQETCNIDEYAEDWGITGADYVLNKDGFFLFSSNFENFYLQFSKSDFFDNFKKPTKYISSIEGEIWTLYAIEKEIDGKRAKIMVGWIEEMPGLLAKTPGSEKVNEALIKEADKIASQLSVRNEEIVSESIKSKVDGFQVINVESKKVIKWGGSIPAFLPENVKKGFPTYIDNESNLYLVRDEVQKGIRAVSLSYIANLKWFTASSSLMLLTIFVLVYIAGSTYFKKWLLLYRRNLPSTADMLKKGEGQEVEFKRGIVDDEILKSVTAFANTNDGVIVVGIDDKGRIAGLDLRSVKKKERFIHSLFNLLRARIKPALNIKIDFENLRGFEIAKIFIPRGDEPLYYFDGVIYVRHGDSDIKSSPELIKKILAEYTV